jgi:micrococcal nuclease
MIFRLFYLLRRVLRKCARPKPARRPKATIRSDAIRDEVSPELNRKALSEREIRSQIQNLPTARVRYVIDGDTVIVTRWWLDTIIRLDSIDCPEDGQTWGDIATYGLIKLIGGRTVQLEKHGLDRYGRTLATLYVRDRQKWLNVNERMVTLGHAWVMQRYYDHLPRDRQDKLKHLERWARSRRVGLWRNPDPVPPWNWRNGR